MVGVPQLSEAVAAKVTVALQRPAAAFTLMFAGQVIEGAVLSMPAPTVAVVLAEVPQASVTVTE